MKRLLEAAVVAAVLALFVGAYAIADQIIGVGSGYWSGRLSATTTSAAMQDLSDAATRNALFPCGTGLSYSMVQVHSAGAARAAFAGHPGATLGAMIFDDDTVLGRGAGDIRSFNALGGEWHSRPYWSALYGRPGGALGICNTAVTGRSNELGNLYPACVVDGDCPSGTCRLSGWTTEQLDRVACYLIGESDSGTVVIDAHKETVRR